MVLNEALSMRLYQLAGVPASNTNFVHFRIIDRAAEADPADQYEGDFWGLYIAIEQADGHFLDEHELPDGNFYKMAGSGSHLTNQGPTQVDDRSDLNAFTSGVTGYNATGPIQPLNWWQANCDLPEYYSYNAVSVGVNNSDRRPEWNGMYYNNPLTDQWSMCPWDLDLTYEYGPHYGDMEHWRYVFGHPAAAIDYANRARELLDLLFNADEGARLVDEFAGFVSRPGGPTFVQANRAQWDYHPRVAARGRAGSFYVRNEYLDYLNQHNFVGVVAYMKRFISGQAWPAGVWQPSASVYGGLLLVSNAADANIPNQPTMTYIGAAGYPINDLRFQAGAFSDPQGAGTFAAMKWRIGEVSDPADPAFDPTDWQKYEVEALWESGEIAPYVATVTIPPDNLRLNRRYRVRVRMKDDSGRWSHWSDAVEFVATEPNNAVALLENLRISEIMFNPPDGGEYEFVELVNVSPSLTLDLAGASFTAGIDCTIPSGVTLAPQSYLLVVRADPLNDFQAFRAHYGLGAGVTIVGPYDGGLNNDGEELRLKTAAGGATIIEFSFNDSREWPQAADGGGHSLVPLAAALAAQAQGSGDYGGNWRASTTIGGSPGAADPAPPAGGPTGILLNEVAAHTDQRDSRNPPPPDSNDWIELVNTMAGDIVLNDCYLSDDIEALTKWRIPNGTLIRAGGFLSFDEINDFHVGGGFGLNKDGESVVLSHLPGTSADRVLDEVRFKGQENGATLGRYPDGAVAAGPAVGSWRAMAPTRDAANSPPPLEPVINQFMYNPGDGATTGEFIEIHNPTGLAVELWGAAGRWRTAGGVDYVFTGPEGSTVTLPAGGYLLLLPFDPADAAALNAFQARYGVAGLTAQLFGPYTGSLSNGGERLALERPQAPDLPGDPPSWVLADETFYFDRAPFPPEADGLGQALHRIAADASGVPPTNWTAAPRDLAHSGVTAPVVANQPASGVSHNAATLNGILTLTGGENPTVRIHWGATDGGANPGSWAQFEDLGVRGAGAFSAAISGLTPNTVYHHRVVAFNSADHAWSSDMTFTTPDSESPPPPSPVQAAARHWWILH